MRIFKKPFGFGPGLKRKNNIPDGLAEMELYRDRCVMVDDGVQMDELGIDLREELPIYIGNFIDRDQPPYKSINLEVSP